MDCQRDMIHPLNRDNQSLSTGSGGCLFAGCGFWLAEAGFTGAAGAVTVGLDAESSWAATCVGGATAVPGCWLPGAIGEGDSDALSPFASPNLDLYLSTTDCSAGRSSFAR